MSIRTFIGPVIGGIVALSSVAFAFVIYSMPLDACSPGGSNENYKQTVEFLVSVLELGLSLSTALLGLTAALLIGVQGGLSLTVTSLSLVITTMICLAQAVIYGVLWKFQIANLWFNQCYHLIGAAKIQVFYQAHFYFFMAGVLSIGILVSAVGLERLRKSGGSDEV